MYGNGLKRFEIKAEQKCHAKNMHAVQPGQEQILRKARQPANRQHVEELDQLLTNRETNDPKTDRLSTAIAPEAAGRLRTGDQISPRQFLGQNQFISFLFNCNFLQSIT